MHPILSVVAVVQILASVHSGESWERAIEAHLPRRAIKRRERELRAVKKRRR